MPLSDARQYSPATLRNRSLILTVLQQVLPAERFKGKTVLEISSGTGEHSVFFAPRLPYLRWLPSDPNPLARDSISAWQAAEPAPNLNPPIDLDTMASPWAVEQMAAYQGNIAAVVNINMIHISPWQACEGLMAGAARILPVDGILYLYGPFLQRGVATAPSNLAFDQSLKARDQRWGIRQLETVIELARSQALWHQQTIEMPANNLSVIFQRR
ncbi:MAG: DUF938 domain-containing protein [Cyanobacteria bacterium P01_H01_bin.119]